MFQEKKNIILEKIQYYLEKYKKEKFIRQIKLLETINGVDFISAVSIMCEIGDFSAFTKPKQLVAYFGIDPCVKQSGKFKGTQVKCRKEVPE